MLSTVCPTLLPSIRCSDVLILLINCSPRSSLRRAPSGHVAANMSPTARLEWSTLHRDHSLYSPCKVLAAVAFHCIAPYKILRTTTSNKWKCSSQKRKSRVKSIPGSGIWDRIRSWILGLCFEFLTWGTEDRGQRGQRSRSGVRIPWGIYTSLENSREKRASPVFFTRNFSRVVLYIVYTIYPASARAHINCVCYDIDQYLLCFTTSYFVYTWI